jgi:hypothetical protein
MSESGPRGDALPWNSAMGRLDNAGIVMPAVADRVNSTYFRIEAELREDVDVARLQASIDAFSRRLAHVFVSLRPRCFGYGFEPLAAPPRVEPDDGVPCMGADIRRRGTPLLRVKAGGRLLGFEFSHALADGYGSFAVMKALLAEYAGEGAEGRAGLIVPDGAIPPGEYEDAYRKYYRPGLAWPAPRPKAFRIALPAAPAGKYRVTRLELGLEPMLARARSLGASLTEYLAALQLRTLQELRPALAGASPDSGRLTVMIPVDLRRFFPSATLRNFTLYALPGLDPREGELPFGEILERTRNAIRSEATETELSRQISRNVFGERVLPLGALPRFARDAALRLAYAHYGEGILTSHFSNMGAIALPPAVSALTKRVSFVPGASAKSGTNMTAASWAGRLWISFGSVLDSPLIEERFAEGLSSQGFAPTVAVSPPA